MGLVPSATDRWVVYYLRRQLALAKILRHQTILEVVEPSALGVVIPGQEHVPQAEGAGLGLEVLQNDGVGLPSLLALAELGLECGFGGDTVLLDELFDLEEPGFVSEVREVRRCGHRTYQVESLLGPVADKGLDQLGNSRRGRHDDRGQGI